MRGTLALPGRGGSQKYKDNATNALIVGAGVQEVPFSLVKEVVDSVVF
ncbi:hypothetical protein [Sulfuracidifex metallicus]|nr:hypothetical protein [Sulfuracidifex metallicus]WOE51266.1 hypothetical protein RQ359_000536 [Sulfuracidifex metallicus DSM 6482 = JCM 9184]